MITKYKLIERMVHAEFPDIVASTRILQRRSPGSAKLRILLKEHTYIDIWLSPTGKYSFHWEQRAKRGLIHRHDNAPDHPEIETFPRHFHSGDEQNIHPSHLNSEPLVAVRQFLEFARELVKSD